MASFKIEMMMDADELIGPKVFRASGALPKCRNQVTDELVTNLFTR